MDEFALIRRHFAALTPAAADVVLGIGDDAALLAPSPGSELAVTSDTLVAGRHFPDRTAPFDIGWKALAVNLSDLAAMGAEPRWFTLALTLPEAEERWLTDFAAGLGELARQTGIALVGGDTTRGPLAVSITAIGQVAVGRALRRSGARPGDAVCVTGTLGDAALGLKFLLDRQFEECERAVAPLLDEPMIGLPRTRGGKVMNLPTPLPRLATVPAPGGFDRPASEDVDLAFLLGRLHRPDARIDAALALRDMAHAAIDLSDGLAGDLTHVLEASGVGAEIEIERLPMSASFARTYLRAERLRLQASGGDDYELCVCLPQERVAAAQDALGALPLTPIGRIVEEPGLRWLGPNGATVEGPNHGYRHF